MNNGSLDIAGSFTITSEALSVRLIRGGETQQPRVELLAAAEVRAGASVPITIRLTNADRAPLELHLVGRQILFDIRVGGEDGEVLWQRLAGQTVQSILQIRTLIPGEHLDLTDVWDQRDLRGRSVSAGRYTLQGIVPTDDPQSSATPVVPLRIISA